MSATKTLQATFEALADLADMNADQWVDEHDSADADADDPRFHQLVAALAVAADAKQHADTVHAVLEEAVAEHLRAFDVSGYVEVPAVGSIQRRVGRPRTRWNHLALLDEMAQRAASGDANFWVDTETGEIAEASPAEAVRRLARFAGFGYWKVTLSVEMNRVEGDGDG